MFIFLADTHLLDIRFDLLGRFDLKGGRRAPDINLQENIRIVRTLLFFWETPIDTGALTERSTYYRFF